MSEFKNAVGLDVSKMTIDIHDHASGMHHKFSNEKNGFKQIMIWIQQLNPEDQPLICFEHTGIYSMPLAIYLTDQNVQFVMVPGLEIKRSLGIQRGKNDQVDAKRIAYYAFLRKEELKPTKIHSRALLKLKSTLSLREKMIKQRSGYKASITEMKRLLKCIDSSNLISCQKRLIAALDVQIKKIESDIKAILMNDVELRKLFELVTSVKGVGLILGASFIAYTNGFTGFESWRKFASYSGIAPFEHRSGTSVRGRSKVSHLANKRMKGLLSNAACCAIQHSPELKSYYQDRLSRGKDKMSTQNIIRNKIVARVFAVVNRQTPYVELAQHAY